MTGAIRLAVIGLGKIARDQHLPTIADTQAFELVATVSPDGEGMPGVTHYAGLDALLADAPALDAVVLCTPPQVRHALASQAIAAGLHVFLEKPPGATLAEVAALEHQAADAGVTLFTGWHSRFAAGVEAARTWLAAQRIKQVRITWREDVRVWHPGQDWIWQPGGLGVFDPGINALSIATHILPRPFFLTDGVLSTPANRAAPIAAVLHFRDAAGLSIAMDLDFRQTGPQSWDIAVDTDAGACLLSEGGAVLTLPDGVTRGENREYAGLYDRFSMLINEGRSDVDVSPFRLVADAFLRGRHETVEPFDD